MTPPSIPHRIRPALPGAGVAALLLLSACAGMPTPSSDTAARQTANLELSRQSTAHAIDLLGAGHLTEARAELARALRLQPDNGPARELMDTLSQDPHRLFGERSFAYRVRPGESMAELAERFLGDRLLFYALARYNNLPAPSEVTAGQGLRIPDLGRPNARSSPAPAQFSPPRRAIAPASVAVAAVAAPVAHDATCAGRLRGRALEEMTAGSIDQAVNHLRLALQCDAGNDLAAHDLDRALRLQALAHGH